jgi:hypothetical protein
MRLDGVEVKVSLDSDQTAAAVQALDLADGAAWKIFFAEDVTTGLCSATPLLDQHLIVRARQKTTGKDDVTIKFRPARRSQLTDSWLATTKTGDGELDSELKVEEDWAGERRMLSISLTAERPDGRVAAVAAGERGIRSLPQPGAGRRPGPQARGPAGPRPRSCSPPHRPRPGRAPGLLPPRRTRLIR